MEHYQQFIDNLIALKSYYQNQVEQYDRLAAESKEQLNHVNALLFDQLQRQYKQHSSNSNTEDTSETTAITHDIKALVFESVPQNISSPELPEVDSNLAILKPLAFEPKLNDTSARTETEAITHDSTLAPATSPPNSSPPLSPVVELNSGILESPPLQVEPELKEPIGLTTDSASSEQHSAANITESPPPISQPLEALGQAFETLKPSVADSAVMAATNNVEQTQPPTASTVAASIERQHYIAPLKTLLRKEYQHLTKSEAVENFLQNNEGKAFHIDEITRSLHGDLGVEAIRAERSRMNDTLRKGVKKGLWSAVPNRDKYYTIDLNSLKSTAKQQELPPQSPLKSTPTPPSKYSDLLKAPYRHLGLNDAVAIVVQENVGEILTPARVTKDLFGDVSQTAFTKAQVMVGKYLRAGAKLGLWQRVPGQLAQYILEK